jgi:hypothetical protein
MDKETPRPSYTVDELLVQCDANAAPTEEGREWLGDGPVGAEIL